MDLRFLIVVQECVWQNFPSFLPSTSTSHRVIMSEGERYILFMLALNLLSIYGLRVAR